MKHFSGLIPYILIVGFGVLFLGSCKSEKGKQVLSDSRSKVTIALIDSLQTVWRQLEPDSLFKTCENLTALELKKPCYLQVLNEFESTKDSLYIVKTYNKLVRIHYDIPAYGTADYYANLAYSKCLEFDIDTLSWEFADAIFHMAMINERKNQFEKSEEFYFKTLAIDEHNKSKYLSNTYNGIGYLFLKKGDFENARLFFNQAMTSENDQRKLIPYLHDMGYLFSKYKHHKLARSYYHKSLRQFNKYGDKKNNYDLQIAFYNYNGLAELDINLNQLDSVNYYLSKAEEVKKQDTLLQKLYLTNLLRGKQAVLEEQFDRALSFFDQSEKEVKNEYKSIERDELITIPFKEKALLFLKQGRYEDALVNIQKALQLVCNSFNSNDPFEVPEIKDIFSKHIAIELLGIKAQIFNSYYKQTNQQKQVAAAFNTYQFIHKLIPVSRQIVAEDVSKFNLAKQASTIYEQAITTSFYLYQKTKNDKYLESTLQFIEGNKTTALLENMKHNSALDKGNLPAEKQLVISSLKTEIDFYEREIRLANNKQEYEAHLLQLKQQYQQQLTALEKQYPEYYTLKYNNQPISIKQIQKTLDKDEILLEYFLTDKLIYLLRISPTESKITTINKRPQFDADLRQLLSIVAERPGNSADIRFYYQLADRLYKDLLGSAQINLEATNKLIIIPDGLLSQLPFGSLLTTPAKPAKGAPFSKDHLEYLIEQTAIGYHYSARLLLETIKTKQETASKLFLGIAPDSKLASSKREVQEIQATLKSGDLMLQKAATKQILLQATTDYRILHFAAHAKQDTRNPKFNEIELFADDRLTSSDIESMRLKADLTVLSACETGVGKLQTGEGVLSLARSFFIAGSPSLVASLWKVDDVSTSALLPGFYDGLTKRMDKSEAIRESKLAYLEAQKMNRGRSHPFYWSGLVVIGNDNVLELN